MTHETEWVQLSMSVWQIVKSLCLGECYIILVQ